MANCALVESCKELAVEVTSGLGSVGKTVERVVEVVNVVKVALDVDI